LAYRGREVVFPGGGTFLTGRLQIGIEAVPSTSKSPSGFPVSYKAVAALSGAAMILPHQA
jgi:hypothetical protein